MPRCPWSSWSSLPQLLPKPAETSVVAANSLSGTLPFYADNPDDFLELVLHSNFSFPDSEWIDVGEGGQRARNIRAPPTPISSTDTNLLHRPHTIMRTHRAPYARHALRMRAVACPRLATCRPSPCHLTRGSA